MFDKKVAVASGNAGRVMVPSLSLTKAIICPTPFRPSPAISPPWLMDWRELNEGWRAVYRERIDLSALVARKSHQPAISPES